MPKKRERKTATARGGSVYRQEKGLVGTLVYWSPDERARAKAAAALAGFKSLQDFCRTAALEKTEAELAAHGVAAEK